MGIYNFKSQFIPYIKDGSKQHTIRGNRKYPDKPGSICHLYHGLRHTGATLIGRAPCVKAEPIEINEYDGGQIWVNGEKLSVDECDLLAWNDGFRYVHLPSTVGCFRNLMLSFWTGRLPFEGAITHWSWKDRLAEPAPVFYGCKSKKAGVLWAQ